MSVKASSQVSMLDITDAYSVTLTSEAFAFVGNTFGAPSGLSCATQVIAYCGTQRCSKVTIGTVSCPSGISASISNNGSNAPTITFTTTATITAACEATIPVTVDGVTINKKFSFAVAKTGATGNGVSSSTVDYQVSSSGTTIPTGTWQPSVPSVSPGQYLWTRTILKYTNGSSSSASYSVGRMGTNGTDGSNGRGIKSTVVTYQAGSSGTSAPTGIWTSSVPATSASAPYLWSKTVITYTDDNAPSTTYSVGSTPEGIVVGGRNLIANSNFIAEATYSTFAPSKPVALVSDIDLNETFLNKTVVFSYFVNNPGERINSAGPLGSRFGLHGKVIWINSSTGATSVYYPFTEYLDASNINKRVQMKFTFTPPSGFDKIQSIGFAFQPNAKPADEEMIWKIGKPKLELGNKATDWTPAPEDLETRVINAETSIIKNNEAIQLRATKTEIANTYATKTDVNNIQVGGRNLIKNSGSRCDFNGIFLGTGNTLTYVSTTLPDGSTGYATKITISPSTNNAIYRIADCVKQDGTFTLSIWYKSGVSTDQNFYLDINDFSFTKYTATSIWKKAIYTQTVTRRNDPSIYNFCDIELTPGHSVIFWHPKLELGNKATDWTPAPEDLETRVTTAESKIDQTAKKISLVVKSGDSESNMVLTDKVCQLVANNINLNGRVTISGLDYDAQTKINNGNDAYNWKTSGEGSSLLSMVKKWTNNAVSDTTTIQGGWIATNTITADKIAAGAITADKIVSNGTITKTYPFYGAIGSAKWVCLGVLVSCGDASICNITVNAGSGYNGGPWQNSKLEIFIKDGWQSSPSTSDAFGVSLVPTNWPTNSGNYVRVMASSHDKCEVWIYMPWGYWNGSYEISGTYGSWTPYTDTNSSNAPTSGTLQSVSEFPNADALDSQIGAWCYNNDRTYINGGKIYTGSITANQIAAGAITADKLAANAITGKTITGGTITGASITGGTITGKTSINVNNQKFYVDSEGNLSASGGIYLRKLSIDESGLNTYIQSFHDGLVCNIYMKAAGKVAVISASESHYVGCVASCDGFNITGTTHANAILPESNATYALGEGGSKGWSNIYIGNASNTYNGLRIINGTTNYNLCGINSSNTMIFGDASWAPYIYVKNTSTPPSGAVQSFTIGDNGSTNINDAHVWLYGRNDTTSRYIGSYLVYARTYGSASNVVVTSNGVLGRSTSSSKRYKHDIREFSVDEVSCLYDLPLKKFKYNNDYISKDDEYYNKDLYGFIVEDLDEVLPISVQHNLDDDAEYTIPEMWNNNIIVPCLLKLIQDLNNRLKKVEEGKEN